MRDLTERFESGQRAVFHPRDREFSMAHAHAIPGCRLAESQVTLINAISRISLCETWHVVIPLGPSVITSDLTRKVGQGPTLVFNGHLRLVGKIRWRNACTSLN